ncbi:MAG TPA: hypothetical protein VMB81_32410 [Candidatus Sulfotelmatobacter sp.]|nr:hypothetical protein [Candidatus Sulfotelmatobacter sp.]
MIQTSLSFLANHPLPIELGTITVGPDGKPQRQARVALEFGFEFAGAEFTARVEPIEAGARLRLDAVLAPMPYTAEQRHHRRDAQIIIRASRQSMHHGRLVLDAQGKIHLVGELGISSPVTPAAVVAATTRMLIAATPWIALLHQHLGPAGKTGGKPMPAPGAGSAAAGAPVNVRAE